MRKTALAFAVTILVLSGCSMHRRLVEHQGNSLVFFAEIPKAHRVYFVSNITNFNKVKAIRIKNNLWEAKVPFKKGFIKYFYLADGKVFLPNCSMKINDGFGGKDCVYVSRM